MTKNFSYHFIAIKQCNMCGSEQEQLLLGKRLNRSQGWNPKKKPGMTVSIIKCSNCNLIYSNPLPIPQDIQQHYGVPPEEYWKEEYFDIDDTYFQGELKQLKSLLEIKSGMKSLDIGAGIGKAMLALSNAGFDAFGIEPSESFFEMAISKNGISTEKLKLSSVENAEFEPDFFDFITFGAVLEHLYDPAISIEKALNWLRPGGLIHLEVPSSHWLTGKIFNLLYRLRNLDYVSNLSPMHEPYHLYEFDLKSFQAHANRQGYSIAHHEYYVCETFLPSVFDGILKPYMRRTNQGMQLAIWIRKKA